LEKEGRISLKEPILEGWKELVFVRAGGTRAPRKIAQRAKVVLWEGGDL